MAGRVALGERRRTVDLRRSVTVAGSLAGRTALVTGASRGIGYAIAETMSRRGANVVLTSRSEQAAQAAAAAIGGERVLGVGAHATDEVAAAGCVASAVERFGSVDILVNNAGTNPAYGPLLDQDKARVMKTLDVNLWAPVLWSGLAWRAWMRDHGGTIVNTASIGGMLVAADLGAYQVSKAALIHLTRQLAFELAPAVRVNAVAPGVVRTRLAEALWKEDEDATAAGVPLRRIGEPADVASAVAFLASDEASWVTGETLVVDGGQMLVGAAGEAVTSGPPAGTAT